VSLCKVGALYNCTVVETVCRHLAHGGTTRQSSEYERAHYLNGIQSLIDLSPVAIKVAGGKIMSAHADLSLKTKVKKLVYTTLWALFLPFSYLGNKLYFFGKNLEFAKDWKAIPNPEWFNHELDLAFFSKWRLPYFFERGIYASEVARDKKVLDLCCGDGSVSALFISPIAKSVVGVDFDPKAIAHAQRRYGQHENIQFSVMDIRSMNFGPKEFDVCLWEAAIEHFTQNEMDQIISTIKRVVVPGGLLHGHTIKKKAQASHHDHEYEFDSLEEMDTFLKKYFSKVEVWERVYKERTNFYFRCVN